MIKPSDHDGFVCEPNTDCDATGAWQVTDKRFEREHASYICPACYSKLTGEWVATCETMDGCTIRAKIVSNTVSLRFHADGEDDGEGMKTRIHRVELAHGLRTVLAGDEDMTVSPINGFSIRITDQGTSCIRIYPEVDGRASIIFPKEHAELLLNML